MPKYCLPKLSLSRTTASKNAGYTLIELMIVSTLVVLLMMTVTSLFMTFLVGNAQTNIRRQIKSEGNAMIDQLEYVFRNAKTIITSSGASIDSGTICSNVAGSDLNITDSNYLDISDLDGNTLRMNYNSTSKKITINSLDLNTTYVIVNAPTIRCYGSTISSKKSMEVIFTLQKEVDSTTFAEQFKTITQIRNQ